MDTWYYEFSQSEWADDMKNRFSDRYQNQRITYNGETHVADVLIDHTVIECIDLNTRTFMPAELGARNIFFIEAGYRVIWLFNMTTRFIEGTIRFARDAYEEECFHHPCRFKYWDFHKFFWASPIMTFDNFPSPDSISDKIAIYFCNMYNPIKVERVEYDEFGMPSWRNSYIDYRYVLKLSDTMDTDACFNNSVVPEFSIDLKRKNYIHNLDQMLVNLNHSYKMKYSSVSGKRQASYLCPIDCSTRFNDCSQCMYCGLIVLLDDASVITDDSWKNNNIPIMTYCCYPVDIEKKKVISKQSQAFLTTYLEGDVKIMQNTHV